MTDARSDNGELPAPTPAAYVRDLGTPVELLEDLGREIIKRSRALDRSNGPDPTRLAERRVEAIAKAVAGLQATEGVDVLGQQADLELDAARYRWLRQSASEVRIMGPDPVVLSFCKNLDEAIDAARLA